jgi:hypothetical protein
MMNPSRLERFGYGKVMKAVIELEMLAVGGSAREVENRCGGDELLAEG